MQLIQTTAASPALTLEAGRGLVDIVSRYTHTFLWLQQYDEGLLQEPAGENGGSLPTPEAARRALSQLKAELIARNEASDLFAREREDGLARHPRQPRTKRIRRARLPQHRKQSRPSALLYREKPSLCRRQ